MKIVVKNGQPIVNNLPKGNEILFFAKVDDFTGYCVIYGPPETCLPKGPNDPFELWDAKVTFGQLNQEMQIYGVTHGHKYYQGGGFVEIRDWEDGQIFFRLRNNKKPSTFNGTLIKEVYLAL